MGQTAACETTGCKQCDLRGADGENALIDDIQVDEIKQDREGVTNGHPTAHEAEPMEGYQEEPSKDFKGGDAAVIVKMVPASEPVSEPVVEKPQEEKPVVLAQETNPQQGADGALQEDIWEQAKSPQEEGAGQDTAPKAAGPVRGPGCFGLIVYIRQLSAIFRNFMLDRLMDGYVDHPHKCFCGCSLLIFLLSVLSIMLGSMNMTLDVETAWLVHDADNTRYKRAYDRALDVLYPDFEDRRRLSESTHNSGKPAQLWAKSFLNVQRSLLAPQPRHVRHSYKLGRLLSNSSLDLPRASPRRTDDHDEDEKYFRLLYKADSNIFIPERLQDICKLEAALGASKYCPNAECFKFTPVQYFYGTSPGENDPAIARRLDSYDWSCSLLPSAHVEATLAQIADSVEKRGAESEYAFLVSPVMETKGTSPLTRTEIRFYEHLGDAEEALKEVLNNAFDPPREWGFMKSPWLGDDDQFIEWRSIRVRMYSNAVEEFESMLMYDFSFAFLSMFVVWIIMYIHMSSCWLASWGMYQILFSLPVGSLFYRQLFGIDYFEFLHVLIVYLVLGIGADDIFVLVDSFKHLSDEHGPPAGEVYTAKEFKKIMKAAYIRSFQAIFNTSFTTAVAFLSCSISKIMPMRTCGWYAAICIVMNYVYVITFTPATVMIWCYRFQGKRCCCPAPRMKKLPLATDQEAAPVPKAARVAPKVGYVDKALRRLYIPAMGYTVGPGIRPVALTVLILMIGTAVQGVYFASQLTPPKDPPVWYPDNHMRNNFAEFMVANYMTADHDRYAPFTLYWGITDMDMDGMDVYDPDNFKGKLVWDSSFDLSTAEAQAHLLETCNLMKTHDCDLEGCKANYKKLMLRTSEKSYSCFLEDFNKWLLDKYGMTGTTGSDFVSKLRQFRDEVPDHEYMDEAMRGDYRKYIGITDEGQLKWVAVQFRSTLTWGEGFGTGTAVRDHVDEFVKSRVAGAPSSMKSMLYHAEGVFMGYDMGEELVNGLYAGCAIAGPLAFLVLIFSTMNIVVAGYAVLAVGSIVMCVLGFCKSSQDWDLGIGEAIAGVIVIGYSVDYVVHLSHMYCESGDQGAHTRAQKCEFAIRNMGSTVFAGAITTALSACFMFLCFFTFFIKMALLIVMTIFFSFIFSLGFFMSALWIVGPEGTCGDLRVLLRKCGCWEALKRLSVRRSKA
mmetsp:Transcript_66997/g.122198  ORF Transcript_66997/g.122198 Transcript_66997/m.122198 type:complete len:1175 (+) Transcript_66997:60-3584(+)